jgi:hypothetical protein
MIMDTLFARRVRIKGGPDELIGWKIVIEDRETGEAITNIFKAVITLIPGELNMVTFTYYEVDKETGQVLLKDGEPIAKEMKVHFPEIDLTALERLQKERNT